MSMDDLLSEWKDGQQDQAGNEIWKEIPGIPAFQNKAVEHLYAWGFDLPTDLVKELLALPRESLIADLEAVLKDAVARHQAYLKKDEEGGEDHPLPMSTLAFPAHAMFFLAELEAQASLPKVLDFLSSDADLLDFYLSELDSVDLWPVLFKLGKNALPELLAFAQNQALSYFYRKLAVQAVAQILWHYGARKKEVHAWFEALLHFYHANSQDEDDALLLGEAISELASLRAQDLLDVMEPLFEEGLVDTAACGTFKEVQGDMYEPVNNWAKVKVKSLLETYLHFTDTWELYADEGEEEEGNFVAGGAFLGAGGKKKQLSSFNPNIRPVQKADKTGRNDLCPCGSGQKFKKCHGA